MRGAGLARTLAAGALAAVALAGAAPAGAAATEAAATQARAAATEAAATPAGTALGRGAAGPPATQAARVTVLSDERTRTLWANPARVAPIRARPAIRARAIARTRLTTEIGRPNVYLALAETTDRQGRRWIRTRVSGRPNGRVGWVARDALGPLHRVATRIVVDRRALTATLERVGRRLMRVGVGIGAPGTPTPGGSYWVTEKLTFSNEPVYGTHALGTSAYAPTLTEWPAGGVVGLHGTSQPELLPGRVSHGCIRVRNDQMRRLWQLTPIGTPVLIR